MQTFGVVTYTMDCSKIGRPLPNGTSWRGRSYFRAPERYFQRLFLFHLERPLVVRTWNGWSKPMPRGLPGWPQREGGQSQEANLTARCSLGLGGKNLPELKFTSLQWPPLYQGALQAFFMCWALCWLVSPWAMQHGSGGGAGAGRLEHRTGVRGLVWGRPLWLTMSNRSEGWRGLWFC